MISLPCIVDDPSLDILFPSAISLFEFGGGYSAATSLEIGKGYWINLPAPYTSSIKGRPSLSQVEFPHGWSMVGPGKNSVAVSSLGDNVISVFGFQLGYFRAITLEPGQGYWINLSTAGTLDLIGSPTAKSLVGLPSEEKPTQAVLWVAKDGRKQMLHLGVPAKQVQALPPRPPSGLFDVRVDVDGVDAWQVPLASEPRDYRLQVQGGTMQLGWRIPSAEHGLWQLVVNEKVIELENQGTFTLEAGADQVFVRQSAAKALPTAFSLGQSFPNPFNPATTIQYNLPEARQVSLKVYNIAGQVVRELVNQHQDAGRHQVVWDGLDSLGAPMANGVYFYELRAGEYRALRKMLLMK